MLKRVYEGTPTHGEGARRIKFQDISECLRTNFPTKKYSPKMVSDAVKLAFPESLRKRCGDSKLSYCYGIIKRDETKPIVCDPTTTVSTSEVSATHTDREMQLLERVKVGVPITW